MDRDDMTGDLVADYLLAAHPDDIARLLADVRHGIRKDRRRRAFQLVTAGLVAAGVVAGGALVAGAAQTTIDDIPDGCHPVVSLREGVRTVKMGEGCAPLPATLIYDDNVAGRYHVQPVILSNGSTFTLNLPVDCGPVEVQADLFLGTWTVDDLRALDESGRSPGPWLLTAALFTNGATPPEWEPFPNAVHLVDLVPCATTTTSTTVPEPTTTTTTEAPPTTTTAAEPTTTTTEQPAPTTTTPEPTTTAVLTPVTVARFTPAPAPTFAGPVVELGTPVEAPLEPAGQAGNAGTLPFTGIPGYFWAMVCAGAAMVAGGLGIRLHRLRSAHTEA